MYELYAARAAFHYSERNRRWRCPRRTSNVVSAEIIAVVRFRRPQILRDKPMLRLPRKASCAKDRNGGVFLGERIATSHLTLIDVEMATMEVVAGGSCRGGVTKAGNFAFVVWRAQMVAKRPAGALSAFSVNRLMTHVNTSSRLRPSTGGGLPRTAP